METDKVFNWDGQKWSPYWNDLDPTEYFHEEHFLLMAIDGDDEVWVGGSYYFEDPIGPPGAPEEDTYFARLPENPGSITAKSFLDEESHIRALLPKEEGVWGIGRDWFLKADGEKSSLGALPNKIASVIVDHGGSTWLNAVISTYFNDYHFLLKFEDQGTGKMDDDQLPYFFPFPNSNVVVELVDNGDFWVSGTNKYYSGSQAEIPPWRAQSGERIEYDFLAGKPAAADIFSEDTQHTWFIYAANDGDQAGYLPAILRLDDGGTPADFDDDRWTEYRGPHHVNSMEDLHVATANGRLWYGDSSGVYLYLDPGWEQLAEEKPKRLVPTAGGILFVDLGEDQVLVIEPEGDPYYRFVASLVRLQPERILSTSRSNEMWTVAKDGAIWYWQGANQMIRRRRLKEWHYESPIGRQPIQVDGNNHVWMTYDENLWRLSPRPSFDVTVNPPTWFIKPEASQSGKIVPIHISGYDGEISLRADQLPSGISAEIEPEKVGVGETALLTLSAEDIPLGAYSLKIRGTSGGVTRSRTVKIYVVEEVYEVQLPLLRGNY